MRVVVRADASPTIGIGHLMRSLALAEALREANDEVVLVTAPGAGPLIERWEREGASVIKIEVPIGSPEDALATRQAVLSAAASWLVLDGYGFDRAYRAAVRDATRLLVIDDHGAERLEADLIANGNLYASDALYPGIAARLLAGPRYAILRREFRIPTGPTPTRDGILVSLGGADPHARTEPLLAALAGRGIRGRVVVGPQQASADEVRACAVSLGWEVISAPEEMAPLLRSCVLAVVGSGTTTLEVVAVGTPMVAVRIAENQLPVADALHRLGLAAVADGDDPDGAADAVANLAGDKDRLASMARLGPGVVDARGALRVAAAMRDALLALRPASIEDAELLLAWRNDLVTRSASFDTAPVSPPHHMAWLVRSLAETGRIVNIAEIEGRPVGVVRLDRRGDNAVISVTVAPSVRGLGLATPLILQGLRHAAELGIARVYAYIRGENKASQKAFAAAGFVIDPDVPAGKAVIMVAWARRRG